MRLFFRRAGAILAEVADKSGRDNTNLLAAALSFYTMLSLAPALWIMLAAGGAMVGRESAHKAVLDWMASNVGPNGAQYLSSVIDQVNQSSRVATVGGVIAVILGATAAFSALQDSLNLIWRQPGLPGRGIVASLLDFARDFFTSRLLAFVIMLLLATFVLASLLLTATLGFAGRYLPLGLPAQGFWLGLADFVSSVLLMMGAFGALYHLLHKRYFAARDIWTGAFVTAVLFGIGKTLIGVYLRTSGFRSAYGAAGSLVLLLLWVYYSAQIFLIGAVFTEVYARLRRTWILPKRDIQPMP
ncbi:MAG: YihY/virulence factor BrkB family protein [Acidobacteriota bacterium]